MHPFLLRLCRWPGAAFTVLPLIITTMMVPLGFSQTTAPSVATDVAIELSPFVVTSDKDTGYAAQTTLSGTRTRTPLRDVASAIGVFTSDLMNDLGATNEKDVLAYSASVVPELGDQAGTLTGNNIAQPVFQFRIRGQAASRARNYFTSLVPPDTYNLDRIEESRGPNAILFGTGGAGGIVNQSTKRATLTRTQTVAAATIGSDEFLRGELDHNHVLIANKLALRFNGMVHDAGGWRPHEFSHEQRATLASTIQIAPRARLYAEVETGKIHDVASRDFGAKDFLSLWLDRGRPTSAARTPSAALGTALTSNQQRVTIVGNDGTARNFQQTLQTTTDVRRRGAVILDERLMPRKALLQGPGSERFIEFHSATGFLELQPARDLFVELAADYQSMSYRRFDPLSGVYQLLGEPGSVYRDGTPNPYAGQLYVDAQWRKVKQNENHRTLRATASYQLSLGRWGRHNLAFMGQQTHTRFFSDPMVVVLLGRPFNPAPFNARNQVFTRAYFNNPSEVDRYAATSWRQIPAQVSVVMDPGAAPLVFNTGWISNGATITDDWLDLRSYLASTQSYFFQDRLVTSLGIRHDDRDSFTRPLRLDEQGISRIDYRGAAERSQASATHGSLGVVVHATPWLSFIYNRSQNAGEPGTRTTLIPNNSLQPISRGQGEDIGVTLSLLQRRVFVRLARFETSMVDDSKAFVTLPNTIERHDRILDTMVTDRILTAAEANQLRYAGGSNMDLLDRRTVGWELSTTANPTSQWRIIFNASQGKSVDTNMLKRTRSIMPAMLATWQRARATSVTSSGATVAQEIADFNTWLTGNTVVEGKTSLGDREWQAKFFNRYDFADGFLKGVFVGGGVRMMSAPTIGANPTLGIFYHGESVAELDLLAGYQTRISWFGRHTRLSVQLNAYDLLQRREYLAVRRDPDGILSTMRVTDPTSYKLQAKLAF